MASMRDFDAPADISALEAAAATARAGFACMFSTSDEYETALINARRAEGRYNPHRDWETIILAGSAVVLGAILIAWVSA